MSPSEASYCSKWRFEMLQKTVKIRLKTERGTTVWCFNETGRAEDQRVFHRMNSTIDKTSWGNFSPILISPLSRGLSQVPSGLKKTFNHFSVEEFHGRLFLATDRAIFSRNRERICCWKSYMLLAYFNDTHWFVFWHNVNTRFTYVFCIPIS